MGRRRKINYEKTFYNIKFLEHQFLDNRIYEAAAQFLAEKKQVVNGNYQTKCGMINQCKKVIRIFFSDGKLENITRKYVLAKF